MDPLRPLFCWHWASLLCINLHLISACINTYTLRKWQFFLYDLTSCEVNHRSLVNKHGDLSIFSLFLGLVNSFILYSEYKQSSIVEKYVIDGNVNFTTTSEDKFGISRSLHGWNKLNCCPVFVLKHIVNCMCTHWI